MMLKGKVVAITGGTRGLGRVLVDTLLQHGCCVAAIARNQPAETLPTGDCIFVQADTALPHSIERAAEEIKQKWNRLDIWINNAGFGKKLPFLAPNNAEWADVFNANFWGTVHGCRAALKNMLEQEGGGSIINIASVAGLMACPEHSAYCTSKAAVMALTRSLAVDYAARGILVNSIAPGPIDTAGFRAAGGDPAQRARSIPTRTMVAPDEIAEVCVFLAQALSSLTGQTLVIDGGSAAIGCYTTTN